jgi:hypothetical protein
MINIDMNNLRRKAAATESVVAIVVVVAAAEVVKCKSSPRTGHEGPGGKLKCSPNLSLNSALDRDGCLTPVVAYLKAHQLSIVYSDPYVRSSIYGSLPAPKCKRRIQTRYSKVLPQLL